MRVQTSRRRFAAIPLLALAFTGTTFTPSHAVSRQDLSQPIAIATNGKGPLAIAVSPSGKHLYVANKGSKSITVIDTVTNSQIKSIPLAERGDGVVVSPDGTVWATQKDADSVAKIVSPLSVTPAITYHRADAALADKPTSTNSSSRAILQEADPGQVVLSLDGSTAYIGTENSIEVVDTATMKVTSTIADAATDLFDDIAWLALSPDGRTLYAVNYASPTMTVIDLAGAISGVPGSMTQVEGPAASSGGGPSYLAGVVALRNAIYVAVEGTGHDDGTTVMRYPIAPKVNPLSTATPGNNLVVSGAALVGATVAIGGVPATTLASGYHSASVTVPDLSSLSSPVDVPVVVTTESGTTHSQIDVSLTTADPTISGSARVGTTLMAVAGAWSPGTKFGYQWLAAGKAISGATKASFTPTSAHVGKAIAVRVTGMYGSWGATTRTSAATIEVCLGTLKTITPKVAGVPKVGRKVTADPGPWTPGTKFSYQWYDDSEAIKGATRSTLKISTSLERKALTVKVTGTKAGYAQVAKTSTPTKTVE